MKIDVPHIFHPYMIGPSGRKSQDLMVNTSVLVHYNDSNFRCPTWPKMNTVTIDGRMRNVEAARSGMRVSGFAELVNVPVVLLFCCSG